MFKFLAVCIEHHAVYCSLFLAKLKKWLQIVAESTEQDIIDEKLDHIYELINNVQIANDECDFGMGLELGLDLFCSGCKLVHKQTKQLLTMAYTLLKRPRYARILEMHLDARNLKPMTINV